VAKVLPFAKAGLHDWHSRFDALRAARPAFHSSNLRPLDTNSCVDHLRRGQSSNITGKLAAAVPGNVVLSSVVVAEHFPDLEAKNKKSRRGGTLLEADFTRWDQVAAWAIDWSRKDGQS
jgi:hypothetical protein